jgi:sRNA-binding regulator protein Hfq
MWGNNPDSTIPGGILMDGTGNVSFGHDINQITEALRNISNQLQALRQMNSEDSEGLGKYMEDGEPLEFILVTGGLIRGEIVWMGDQSFGVRNDSGQDVIVYKHAIAFIQK